MMSHFTTGTSSFILSKYSRSYPIKRLAPKVQLPTHGGPEFSSDWQHFTNPVIRLILDVKTSSDAEIESVKLRIVWEINNGIETCVNSQNVIFEDLDLLSFSFLPFGPQQKNQVEGLPLKAVYRDTVVGIRYLHSREEGGNTPVYRRFQISFQIPSEASEFIQAIKPICPCKLNPNNIPGPALSQMHTLPLRPVMQNTAAPNLAPQNRAASYACPPPSQSLISQKLSLHQRVPSAFPHQTISSPLTTHPSSDPSPFIAVESSSSSSRPSGGTSTYRAQDKPNVNASTADLNSDATHMEIHQLHETNVTPVITQNPPASSLPNSSFPSSSNSGVLSALPVRRGNSSEPTRPSQPILTAVEEFTSVYNLPSSEVERILSEVLHEEGFVQLVERISGMLMAQTLLGG